jgi:uncharacterized protein YndB with AHSA1/START domain
MPQRKSAEAPTTQIYEIYIKASPRQVWDALTTREWTAKYGYQAPVEYDLRPGGKYAAHANERMRSMGLPEIIIDGEVIEADPPKRLVQTFRFLFTEEQRAEGFTRVTWEIEASKPSFTRLTVTHELEGAPIMAAATAHKYSEPGGGGWSWILSDLKSLLETGQTMQEA